MLVELYGFVVLFRLDLVIGATQGADEGWG